MRHEFSLCLSRGLRRHEFSTCLSRGLRRHEFSTCLSRGLRRHVLSHPQGWMMDSPESFNGEASVQGSRVAVGAFQSHALRWNTARKVDEGHHGHLVLNGSQRFQVCEASLTHLADATLVPRRPRESKWLGILVLRTQELGECVS